MDPVVIKRQQMHRVVDDGHKGRAVVAARGIAAGSCLMRTQAHTAVSLTACAHCFAASASIKRCTGCRIVRYCSRRCQQNDWTGGGHGNECAAWKQITRGKASQTVLLVARVAARCLLEAPSSDDTAELLALRHHYDDHSQEKLREYQAMTQLVLLVLARSKWNRLNLSLETMRDSHEREIVQLFCRVNCNAFTICDEVNTPLGIGMFPAAAMLNHSCTPNCVVSFQPNQQLQIRVIRPVEEGAELTISYIELFESSVRRRQALRSSYFFECDCARCAAPPPREDWWLDGFICRQPGCHGDDSVVVYGNGVGTCKNCGGATSSEGDLPRTLSLETDASLSLPERWLHLQHVWASVENTVGHHPRSTHFAEAARALGNFLIDHGDELQLTNADKLTLSFLERERAAIDWVLPSLALPTRGLLCFQLAKLCLKLHRKRDADQYIRQALSILSCSYGGESSIVQSATEFLRTLDG